MSTNKKPRLKCAPPELFVLVDQTGSRWAHETDKDKAERLLAKGSEYPASMYRFRLVRYARCKS